MTAVRWSIRTGHLDDQMRDLLRTAVGDCARGFSGFKIGQTCNPTNRVRRQDYADVYDDMIVIYETTSLAYVDGAERHLIECYPDADNLRSGGGGPKGEPPYYVYVVVRGTVLPPSDDSGRLLRSCPEMITCLSCAAVVPGPNFCGMCGVSFANTHSSVAVAALRLRGPHERSG